MISSKMTRKRDRMGKIRKSGKKKVRILMTMNSSRKMENSKKVKVPKKLDLSIINEESLYEKYCLGGKGEIIIYFGLLLFLFSLLLLESSSKCFS